MQRNQQGFTLVEITVVLVLMAIISAYVIGRSLNTEQIDLAGETDKIRNQIRYVQSIAMKQSDAIWGITCNNNQYWMFRTNPATPETLPGEQSAQINLSGQGINMSNFVVFFDQFSRPYDAYTNETNNNPLLSPLDINIALAGGGQSRIIRVNPETGLVQ